MADDLWQIVAEGFRTHICPKQGDKTWQDAMNRIAKKVLVAKGIQAPPTLSEAECTIQRLVRTRKQLSLIESHHQRRRPLPDSVGPPILLAYGDREYIIDGHNRINNYLASQRQDPLEVILLTPRKVA